MSLGEKLKILRLKTRKTLSQQGRILKVSMNSVYRWEHNLAVPRRAMLLKMADYFGVPLDWLLTDTASVSLANDSELILLRMFKILSDKSKHKAIGYIERMYVEETNSDY